MLRRRSDNRCAFRQESRNARPNLSSWCDQFDHGEALSEMSYFQFPESIARQWNESYRIAEDYFKVATNTLGIKTNDFIPAVFQPPSSSRSILTERRLVENPDVWLFLGTALAMRVSMFWRQQPRRRSVLDSRRLAASSKQHHSWIESACYVLASYWTIFLPLIPAMSALRGERIAPHVERLQSNRELILFTGTALFFRCVYWRFRPPVDRRRRRRDGYARDPAVLEDETKLYLIKVQNGFKDPKLQQFIDTCVDRKEKLKKVGSPEDLRKEKVDRLKKQNLTAIKGPLQLSEEKLMSIRSNLNRVYDEVV